MHPGHRAVIPEASAATSITDEPVQLSTGQPTASSDAVLWAIGRVRPNTGWLPAELLDEHGFVRVTPELRVPDIRGLRDRRRRRDRSAAQSARNRADGLLVRNILAEFSDRPLRSFRPAHRRWGSVLGIQPDGLEVFAPNGKAFRFPAWSFERVLMSWVVRCGIYRGVRENQPPLT